MIKNGITTQQIYQLVNDMRKEVMDNLIRLETKFDTLEAGRLSQLERDFAQLTGRIYGATLVISIVVSMVVSIAIAFWG